MKTLYMAYGSNLNLQQMAQRCPSAKVFGTAMLEGYQLVFHRVATIVPSKDSVVPVAIWEIDAECEKALDRYEGFPRLYRKEYLKLKVKGVEQTVMVYIMNGGKKELPSSRYYNTIAQGYYDVGFDIIHLRNALAATLE